MISSPGKSFHGQYNPKKRKNKLTSEKTEAVSAMHHPSLRETSANPLRIL